MSVCIAFLIPDKLEFYKDSEFKKDSVNGFMYHKWQKLVLLNGQMIESLALLYI